MSETPEIAVGVAIIVVAAGSGTRLGAGFPKAFVACGGQTLLERALHSIFGMERPAQVIVVAPAGELARAHALATAAAGHARDHVSVVAGGSTRQQSVAAGLGELQASVRTVLVHDAARSLTPTSQFERVIDAVVASGDGVVPGLAVSDTIKRVGPDSVVVDTVDRSALRAMQTPQGFPRAELVAAYADADHEYTDDAALFAEAGHRVTVIDGDALAFKVTTPWDLQRAEQLVGRVPDARAGIGVDVHAFDDTAELWLAGLFWPGERGLAGHSDGDAVCHAMTDALLSAAGLGDIGTVFGTDDARFDGAHGEVFLSATIERLSQEGFAVSNVAVQVIANAPRFSARRDEAQRVLTEIVGAPVSLSATTSDALGFTGRGDGLAAIATALVRYVGDRR